MTSFFIARRLISEKQGSFPRTILRIAVIAIALCVCIMILARAMSVGFKQQISQKVFGFWGHIHITDVHVNAAFLESAPISRQQVFLDTLPLKKAIGYMKPDNPYSDQPNWTQAQTNKGISHLQAYAVKPGIIKTKQTIEGILLKGVGKDFNWDFLDQYITEGKGITFPDSSASTDILVSRTTADRLQLTVGDKFMVHFVEKNEQLRRVFKICGIYKTGLQEYDKKLALIDLREVQSLLGWDENQIAGWEVFVEDIDDLEPIRDYLQQDVLPMDLAANSIKEEQPTIFEWLELQNINEKLILGLMLVIGVINMVTVMLILVLERIEMIGILKAMGYGNWMLRKLFLYYASYILLLGLFFGNLFGIGLAWLQKTYSIIPLPEEDYYLNAVPISLDFSAILTLNVVVIIVTLLTLLLPSWLVARISPVKAIRFK